MAPWPTDDWWRSTAQFFFREHHRDMAWFMNQTLPQVLSYIDAVAPPRTCTSLAEAARIAQEEADDA